MNKHLLHKICSLYLKAITDLSNAKKASQYSDKPKPAPVPEKPQPAAPGKIQMPMHLPAAPFPATDKTSKDFVTPEFKVPDNTQAFG